jgi:hypothetical protein
MASSLAFEPHIWNCLAVKPASSALCFLVSLSIAGQIDWHAMVLQDLIT